MAGTRPSMTKPMPERYEYKVVEVPESLVGGKMSGGKLERLLNDHASQGWQLKTITSAARKGRVGPGGPRASLSPSSVVVVGHHLGADRGRRFTPTGTRAVRRVRRTSFDKERPSDG
jgi:hypothetical protein